MTELSFTANIKPLFRETDREAMDWAFDLWRFEDVRDNAEAILEKLEAGEMPCDGSWPKEDIARFRNWVESGTAP